MGMHLKDDWENYYTPEYRQLLGNIHLFQEWLKSQPVVVERDRILASLSIALKAAAEAQTAQTPTSERAPSDSQT